MDPMQAPVKVRIRNSLAVRRTLVLEPWTTEIAVEPGETVMLLAEGDTRMPLEVEFYEDRIIVYAFDSEGALLTVLAEDSGT